MIVKELSMAAEPSPAPLTYGSYLRVPELTDLQSPLTQPLVRDEMLFIIGQQAQELWFKQILFDLREVIVLLDHDSVISAARLLDRVNRILKMLNEETAVMEQVAPAQFQRFRGALKAASGLESEQFRELEIASGMRDPAYLRMAGKLVDLPAVLQHWPRSLHDILLTTLYRIDPDPVQALIALYCDSDDTPDMYLLVEAFSEYEVRFQEWRFHHLQLVERVIGDHSSGTGGSAGSAYLTRTLGYRFFPELWEARNRLAGHRINGSIST